MSGSGLRETKQQQTKQAIFEAAMALFAEQGFDETSVEQIVTRAGVSRATYFNYFGTKDGVLRFYGQQLAQRLTDLASAGDGAASPLARLRTLVDAWADYSRQNREYARTVLLYSARDPEYVSGLTPARRQMFEMIDRLVEAGQAAGELRRDIPSKHMTIHVISVFYNAIGMHIVSGEPLEPLLDSAWRVVLEGICHEGV